MSSAKRIDALVDLQDDYVIVVPPVEETKDVLDLEEEGGSELAFHHALFQIYGLRRNKAYKQELLARIRTPRTKRFMIRTPQFSREFGRHLLLPEGEGEVKPMTVIISNSELGRVNASSKYMYKRVRVKLAGNGKTVTLLFQPSRLLPEPAQIWTLIVLLGEQGFLEAMDNSGYRLDREVIREALAEVKSVFHLSKDKSALFATPYEQIKKKHGPLKAMNAQQACWYASVPELEEVIEKGAVQLSNPRK